MASDRNPIVIPKADSRVRGCANCGDPRWTGRNVQGVVTFTCGKCGFKWQGGLPMVPMDPTVPYPPDPETDVRFVENLKIEGGIEEIRKKPDMRTDFRKGALVPNEDEE